MNLGGPGLRPPNLSPSFNPPLVHPSFLPFPLVDSPGDLGRSRSPAAKHFDTIIYTVKQPYKIHIDV